MQSISEGQKIWNQVIAVFKKQVSASMFKTWFGGSYVVGFEKKENENFLKIGVGNGFIKEQIENRYLNPIYTIAQEKFANLKVIFVVSQKHKREPLKNEPIFSGEPLTYASGFRKSWALNPGFLLENFVVGVSNNLAYLAANQVAQNPGSSYNPLFIYGPTGVGKTHLLQAIGNEVLSKIEGTRVVYASAEKFTNDYLESLQNRTTPMFRAKYRSASCLLVDDVQFLAGKESTQDEFFYTFNELSLAGRQIVLASDRHPKELGKLKERLAGRFLGGLTCDIGIPDLEMKIAIIRTKCQERGVGLDSDTVSYIAQSCQGSTREVEGLLVSVISLMKLSGGKVDFPQIQKLVASNVVNLKARPDPERIIGAVCNHFKVEKGDLLSPKRGSSLVFARQVLMYLLRKDLAMPLVGIGQVAGGRDHSTVIYGIQKVESFLATNRVSRDEILRIQAEY